MASGRRFSRRAVLGASVVLGGIAWGGSVLARLARDPSGIKSAGRIADIDGIALPLAPPARAPAHDPALPWAMKGGALNDASALSETRVYGVVEVGEEDDVARALAFARQNGLKVSIAAVRHSMGGHAFDDNALVLDLRKFNRIELNETTRTVTVQTGATWHDIQNVLHPRFAVKAMQSTDIFSVGGSISVNAHGMDHQAGSVAGTIRSMRVMLADGSVVTCSPNLNADLFRHVVGGYGLFGVVLTAELDVTDNAIYQTSREIIRSEDFPRFFAEELEPDDGVGLFYGHLSTSSANLLEEMIVYRYDRVETDEVSELPALGAPGMVKLKRLIINLAKRGEVFRDLKWYVEKNLEPRFETCTIPRTAAMGEGEACLVMRNNPMHDSVRYLFNDLPEETDILHEYFVPRGEYNAFIAGARQVLRKHDGNLLNASVRIVHADDIALSYARAPAFSLVLYINQSTDAEGNAKMRALTRDLIDLTLKHRGRFFLPYQLHFTGAQLLASYPELPTVLAKKGEVDPGELFGSTFYRAVKSMVGTA